MLTLLIFVPAVFLALLLPEKSLSIDSSHPRYATLVRCRDVDRPTWPQGGPAADASMAHCIKELLLTAGDRYKAGQGVPALGIEKGDPLEIPFIRLDIPALNIECNATNAVFAGQASTFTEERMHVNVSTKDKTAQAHFKAPRINGTGDFVMSINLFRVMFPGANLGDGPVVKGRLEAVFENVELTMFLVLRAASDKRHGLKVRNVGMKMKFNEIDLKISPQFGGEEDRRQKDQQQALVNLMNTVSQIEEIRRAIMNEMEPSISSVFAKANFRLLNKGFDSIEVL